MFKKQIYIFYILIFRNYFNFFNFLIFSIENLFYDFELHTR